MSKQTANQAAPTEPRPAAVGGKCGQAASRPGPKRVTVAGAAWPATAGTLPCTRARAEHPPAHQHRLQDSSRATTVFRSRIFPPVRQACPCRAACGPLADPAGNAKVIHHTVRRSQPNPWRGLMRLLPPGRGAAASCMWPAVPAHRVPRAQHNIPQQTTQVFPLLPPAPRRSQFSPLKGCSWALTVGRPPDAELGRRWGGGLVVRCWCLGWRRTRSTAISHLPTRYCCRDTAGGVQYGCRLRGCCSTVAPPRTPGPAPLDCSRVPTHHASVPQQDRATRAPAHGDRARRGGCGGPAQVQLQAAVSFIAASARPEAIRPKPSRSRE